MKEKIFKKREKRNIKIKNKLRNRFKLSNMK